MTAATSPRRRAARSSRHAAAASGLRWMMACPAALARNSSRPRRAPRIRRGRHRARPDRPAPARGVLRRLRQRMPRRGIRCGKRPAARPRPARQRRRRRLEIRIEKPRAGRRADDPGQPVEHHRRGRGARMVAPHDLLQRLGRRQRRQPGRSVPPPVEQHEGIDPGAPAMRRLPRHAHIAVTVVAGAAVPRDEVAQRRRRRPGQRQPQARRDAERHGPAIVRERQDVVGEKPAARRRELHRKRRLAGPEIADKDDEPPFDLDRRRVQAEPVRRGGDEPIAELDEERAGRRHVAQPRERLHEPRRGDAVARRPAPDGDRRRRRVRQRRRRPGRGDRRKVPRDRAGTVEPDRQAGAGEVERERRGGATAALPPATKLK